MGLNTEGTYWSKHGKYEKESTTLEALVVPRGAMAFGSPIECFRVMSNCYRDLYNNGAGNTDVRAEEFVGMLTFLRKNHVLPESDRLPHDIQECFDFVKEFVDVMDGKYAPDYTWGFSSDDEDEEEEYDKANDMPAAGVLYEPYERLMDAIIEMCMAVDDPTVPLRSRPNY